MAMAINATGSATTSGATTPTTTTSQVLGKDDFLKLLITQMRYQDPLNPMDNSQFLAQMAQFTSLEQMQNLNTSFTQSMQLTQSLNNTASASFIGKHVRAAGDTVTLGSNGSVELGYFLPADAQSVTVTVLDSSGREVRTLVSDGLSTGAHNVTWNGADLDGQRLAAGKYTFKVSAKDADGAEIAGTSLVNGLVQGITYKSGVAYLLVDGREVPLSDVLEVTQ
jgi:flagellar basal-body rod modification protein FlgD